MVPLRFHGGRYKFKLWDYQLKTVFAAERHGLCYRGAMQRFSRNWIRIAAALVFLAASPMHAASPYDDYYDSYPAAANGQQPAYPADNDAYYTPPGSYTDNDAYYVAPGSYYQYETPQPQSQGGCNTIGESPSCGGG